MVKDRTIVIAFLTTIILLALIFIIVKVNNDDDDDDDDDGSSEELLNAVATTIKPLLCPCLNKDDPNDSSEEHTTTTDSPSTEGKSFSKISSIFLGSVYFVKKLLIYIINCGERTFEHCGSKGDSYRSDAKIWGAPITTICFP